MLPDLSVPTAWPEAVQAIVSRGMLGYFCLPIIGRSSHLLGVMVVERGEPGVLGQAHNRVVQLALDLAGVAIESRKSEELIRHLAHYDELTGLANRTFLIENLERSIARARRGEAQVGVLFVDLDRFKVINDTIGHEAGDTVLREVARRLQDVVRKGDQVARWGGDEFIVMIEQYVDAGTLARVADKLINAISVPIAVDDVEYQLTASIGICTWPDDGPDLQSLLRNADLAMYRAKEQGRNSFRFFSAQMGVSSLERTRLESGLRQAVENDELVLHFQPKLDLVSGEITGIEALLRWQHPQQGLIWPLKFIELAEETGHIVAIGRSVLRKACEQMRAWQMAGLTSGRIAVNLSARQLLSEGLISDVARALEESGLPPGMLELEITESMLMNNSRAALKALAELHSMGVHLSMDDFGTGYSSLANLKRYPIDSVKIDRSFIRDLPHDSNDAAVTEAVVAMAHALKLRVVAEGVETEAQLNFLHAQKCDEIQGYYFSRPVAAAVLEDFMRRYVSSDRIRLALQGGQSKTPAAPPLLPSRDLG
jgi:diguanylate cyclase (GGDEF)-like protein